jgi:hypothetical protein
MRLQGLGKAQNRMLYQDTEATTRHLAQVLVDREPLSRECWSLGAILTPSKAVNLDRSPHCKVDHLFSANDASLLTGLGLGTEARIAVMSRALHIIVPLETLPLVRCKRNVP